MSLKHKNVVQTDEQDGVSHGGLNHSDKGQERTGEHGHEGAIAVECDRGT